MAVKVIMPQAGQDLETGVVKHWHKAEGDPVAKGEPIVQIETEKVNLDVEAPAAGVLLRIVVLRTRPRRDLLDDRDHRGARRGHLRDGLSRGTADGSGRATGQGVEGARRMSLIGIDLGTSAIKVGAYAVDGTALAEAHRGVAGSHPEPGHSEVDVFASRGGVPVGAPRGRRASGPARRTRRWRSRSARRAGRCSRWRRTARRSGAA